MNYPNCSESSRQSVKKTTFLSKMELKSFHIPLLQNFANHYSYRHIQNQLNDTLYSTSHNRRRNHMNFSRDNNNNKLGKPFLRKPNYPRNNNNNTIRNHFKQHKPNKKTSLNYMSNKTNNIKSKIISRRLFGYLGFMAYQPL